MVEPASCDLSLRAHNPITVSHHVSTDQEQELKDRLESLSQNFDQDVFQFLFQEVICKRNYSLQYAIYAFDISLSTMINFNSYP